MVEELHEYVVHAIDKHLSLKLNELWILFHEATDELQRDNTVTMNKAIPLVMLLEKGLSSLTETEPSFNDVKETLLNSLRSQFEFLNSISHKCYKFGIQHKTECHRENELSFLFC